MFRAKLLAGIEAAGLTLPGSHPEQWVVDCRSVGTGEKALIYLGRYLYRGVIAEKDIVACDNAQVTFRYRNGKTGRMEQRTVSGAQFLWLVVQHVLPKGFRRGAQFRLSASELQASDCFAAPVAQVRAGLGIGLGQGAGADPVRLLRGGDGDRENADSNTVRGVARPPCRRGRPLTM